MKTGKYIRRHLPIPRTSSVIFQKAEFTKGIPTIPADVIYTITDGKVYKGTSSYTSEIEFTIKDSKIYKGTSSYTSDILATIEDKKVYSGTSSYTSDIVFTIKGNLTIEEFVAVWYAVKYCY